MKKTKPTLDEIRQKMTEFQKELLQRIWQYFRTNADWPTIRQLYSDYGKQKIKKALSPMGWSVGREESGSTRWNLYKLSLLGALLTRDGLAFQRLLVRFFEYQRELFKKEPKKDFSTSAEITTAMGLNAEETTLLGQLLWLGNLGGGRGQDGSWSVSAMDEAENFPKRGDLAARAEEWAFRFYQSNSPVFMEDQRILHHQAPVIPMMAGYAVAATEPHPPEIAVSLEKLHNKYPDPTKLGFLVMRIAEGKPFQRIMEVIKRTAQKHGLAIVRADENDFHADMFGNVRTLLHGCRFGIAVYERIEAEKPNANVGLEVGYLMAMNKPVLLLKDKTIPELQADLAGKLYKAFDPHEPEKTIPEQLTRWLADSGIIVSKQS